MKHCNNRSLASGALAVLYATGFQHFKIYIGFRVNWVER
jgi:hypothetical protein